MFLCKIWDEDNTAENKEVTFQTRTFGRDKTDEELLEKTGGIIRGMSGSPILQNGKIAGIVTNVLISDPKIGYGVFMDLVLNEM